MCFLSFSCPIIIAPSFLKPMNFWISFIWSQRAGKSNCHCVFPSMGSGKVSIDNPLLLIFFPLTRYAPYSYFPIISPFPFHFINTHNIWTRPPFFFLQTPMQIKLHYTLYLYFSKWCEHGIVQLSHFLPCWIVSATIIFLRLLKVQEITLLWK